MMDVLLYDSTLCRLCAQENSNGILIFNNDEIETDLCILINKYMPLKIVDDGKFPCTICPGCNIQLEATMQFLELVIAGQAKLREIFKQQQEELKQLEKEDGDNFSTIESDPLEITNDALSGTVQRIFVQQNNGETEEILLQILSDGKIYGDDHEQRLKTEGLDKPRRKRGRPPKSAAPVEEKPIESLTKSEETVKKEISEEEDDQETDGRRRRRRKVPSRYREAVQGKELERMFREEGVIGENESLEEDDKNSDTKLDITLFPTGDEKAEVIGHLETKEGQDLGELIVANRPQKSRHRGRLRKRRFRYVCDVCCKGFQNLGRFNLHKALHKDAKFECGTCNERFNCKVDLLNHRKETEHTGELIIEILPDQAEASEELNKDNTDVTWSKLQCEQCPKIFATKQGLEIHLKGVHEKKRPFTCSYCDKTFAYIASLKCHLLSHEVKGNKGYPCDICGKILNHPSSIIYHKQSEHNNGRRFVCNKCNKSFKHKQLLQRHQLVHTSQRPFECKTCGSQFKARTNLINHELIHTGVKKYTCDKCGQQFAHKTSLKLHYRWHNGQKPYQCVFCEKSFSQNGNLQEHIRIHTGVKPYGCEFCGRKFTTSSQHKLHLKRHTGERPWTCNICSKTFLSKETWTNHSRRHLSEKPYKCGTCNRGFVDYKALKKHLRTHTGEKPYVCNICYRAFSDCSNLTKHRRIHEKNLDMKLDEEIWQKMQEIHANFDKKDEEPDSLSLNNDANQIYYVTYNENVDESPPKTTLQLVEELEGSIKLNENNVVDQQSIEINGVEFTTSDNQLQVTDEDGNPINFTTKDGHELRVTTYDGEQLQVTTPDGTIIPVELNIENGQAIAVEKTNDQDDETNEIKLQVNEISSDELGENQTFEFLTQDGLKVQLITTKADLETEYLSVV
ncbi:zinc finger protein 271-like [Chrysoperla carnea]|uniref:zinc finger protein 271-like n=1 Tax=Chrysoperla carnea TaxID=189513 RepID=UPI001D08A60F|nr:zinc finger protein 271-like [Chrysoperla carnea]